ncbi:MAG: M23 family metallopeptidase [Muribaculaceae bacterium]|nr:M23 family metallopeptidase [Muribaculaceae bacterium]
MKESNKTSTRFKTQKKFRLTFINENSFNEVWSIKMSRTRVILSIFVILIAIGCIVSTLIVSTPIRTLLPGYLKTSQRQENVINSMRIDSLSTNVNINNAYLSNIINILNDNIDTTSVTLPLVSDTIKHIPIDSIINSSSLERQFIQQFEDQEKFNLSVLAPIVAEGMMFYTPIYGASVKENDSPLSIELITPTNSPISTIYNGTIIDSYYLPDIGNVIIIQHPNDFISKYSGINETFVSKGDKVTTGQRIGLSNKNKQSFSFELWHKGTQLNPLDYIAF